MSSSSEDQPVEYSILLQAPAKLTLSLEITGVRDDGLHLIRAEMVTVDYYDTLELAPGREGLVVVNGDDDIPTGPDNLVNRALALVGRRAAVRLTKRIPSEAGLGGGSSDAGAILRWAGFDDLEAAAALGADVVFCTIGGRALVEGFGQRLTPLPHRDQTFTLFTPPVACPTKAVYRAWDELGGPKGEAGNDLEPAALAVSPELQRWRDQLAEVTGRRPRLAGSGSTWFVEGAFPGAQRVVCHSAPPPEPQALVH
ncbi:MAG: 4-(cytidine 5'-diphospho)-2-C-methyl-D-erythritol kinase [Acidimicrobiia bacterium]|nr:4-(cytidine 5'-diphospho)-2-C-methyl-D-erythritol kinase [Acidimicrobiia bacterium]